MTNQTAPQCPHCCKRDRVVKTGEQRRHRHSGGFFDDDPDEGGDFHSRNPAARLERQERRRR